jgi:hypothetical protein
VCLYDYAALAVCVLRLLRQIDKEDEGSSLLLSSLLLALMEAGLGMLIHCFSVNNALGTDVNCETPKRKTPLHIAAAKSSVVFMVFLIID